MSGFVKIAMDDYYSDSNWTTIINKYWIQAETMAGKFHTSQTFYSGKFLQANRFKCNGSNLIKSN